MIVMSDFYHHHFREYHKKTFFVDMSSVLIPLVRRLPPRDSRTPVRYRVLDVGCGSGRDLLWLKQQGFRVTGFERSPGLAELARENAECEVIADDFEQYDFTRLSADIILLMGSLVHVPHEKFGQTFQNIMNALKSEGYVLISLKEGTGTRTDNYGRMFYLWQDETLRKVFSDNGFSVLEYFRQVSKIGTDEIWLAYILRKS